MNIGFLCHDTCTLRKKAITPAVRALCHATAMLLVLGDVVCANQLPERTESLHYEVANNYSYKLTMVIDSFVQKQAQVKDASQLAMTYDPRDISFRFVNGWVEDADGGRHKPAADAIFTRPSAASRDAPGFVSSVTTTVVMPKVTIGSHVHYEIEETAPKMPLMGFNPVAWLNPFQNASEHVVIDIPAALPLAVASQGGFVVSDTTTNGMRHIVADVRLQGVSARDKEQHMAALAEFEPLFLATSLNNYEELGSLYYRLNKDKSVVTPEIDALAKRLVGDRKGIDAARAIYDWTARNIRYLAVYMSDDAGWESHSAATVLKNGYGDCKDHVTLMQALLKAAGIRSEAGLVDWSDRARPLPLWSPDEINHAIVYLPDFDIFANPTSPFTPFGVLDQGLNGKLVIMAGTHGEVRHTPEITPETAKFVTEGTIHIASDGTVTGEATATMSPSIEESLRSVLQDPDENNRRMDRKLRGTAEGGFGRLDTTDAYDTDRPFKLTMDWRSPYGINPEARAFVLPSPPNFDSMDALRAFLSRDGQRHTPLALPIRDLNWNYRVALPPELKIATAPKNVDIQNDIGSYTSIYEREDDQLIVHRRLVLKLKEVAAGSYKDLERLIYAAQNDFTAIVTTSDTQTAPKEVNVDNGKSHS
jgi:transglutaminase-like putative cysteine protease